MDGRSISPDDDVTPRAWAGLAVVASASFVATLDAMVLYVAFGTIRRDFPDVSAAALSWILSVGVLVAARVLQGFGAAALTPASLALILRAFPKSRVPQPLRSGERRER